MRLELLSQLVAWSSGSQPPRGIGEVKGNQVEARYCHFGVLKEVRCTDIAVVELEAIPPPGPTVNQELPSSEEVEIDTLDPRDEENKLRGKPVEDLKDLLLNQSLPDRVLKISDQLSSKCKEELSQCLRANADILPSPITA